MTDLISGAKNQLPTLEFARSWVKERVSEHRFSHITGVANTARLLALRAESDPYRAELAGWLHDACKEIKEDDLVRQGREFGLALHAVEVCHGHLLHGPIAAEVVKRELKIDDEELLDAIRQHTLGGINMTLLSKVVFLADAAEPGRPADLSQPIWQAIDRDNNLGIEDALNLAVRVTCDLSLSDLIRGKRVIHPKTVEVRNFYLELTSNLI